DTVSIAINDGSAADRQAGDFCLILNSGRSGGFVPNAVTPPGFTTLRTASANQFRATISPKILDGTETTVSGINGNDWEVWAVAVFRPAEPIFAFLDHDTGNNDNTNSNPAPQTITIASGTAPIIAYGQMTGRIDITTPIFGDMV